MKILIVSDTYYPHVNGSSYFCQRLATGLKKRGHDVRVLAPSRRFTFESYLHDDIRIYGLPSISVLSHGYRFSPPFFQKRRIEQILNEFKPDVIHCNSHFSPNTVIIPIAKKLHIPMVASNHFVPENLLPYIGSSKIITKVLHRAMWKSWSKIYHQFDAVTSANETAANIIRPHLSGKTVTVISNGINTLRFHPHQYIAKLQSRLKRKANIPAILCVGRLDREKHVHILIEAMKKVIETQPCHLYIAGKGVDQDHLKQLTKDLSLENSVTFLSFVSDEDLPILYNSVDCYAIASIAELQSISTLEAMASGLPVVAARAMALPELVKDGVNGYMFEPDDSNDCATMLLKVLSDDSERKSMGQRSLEIAKQHDSERSFDSYQRLYTSVIAG